MSRQAGRRKHKAEERRRHEDFLRMLGLPLMEVWRRASPAFARLVDLYALRAERVARRYRRARLAPRGGKQ